MVSSPVAFFAPAIRCFSDAIVRLLARRERERREIDQTVDSKNSSERSWNSAHRTNRLIAIDTRPASTYAPP